MIITTTEMSTVQLSFSHLYLLYTKGYGCHQQRGLSQAMYLGYVLCGTTTIHDFRGVIFDADLCF